MLKNINLSQKNRDIYQPVLCREMGQEMWVCGQENGNREDGSPESKDGTSDLLGSQKRRTRFGVNSLGFQNKHAAWDQYHQSNED